MTQVINQKKLEKVLTESIAKFAYLKKGDNTIRIALGTKDVKRIPGTDVKVPKPDANGNLQYFDLEKNNWRKVAVDSPITLIETT